MSLRSHRPPPLSPRQSPKTRSPSPNLRRVFSSSSPTRRTLYEISTSDPQAIRATLLLMEYARLETATLSDVDDSYYFAGECSKCKHRRRLSLTKLRAHLGGEFRLIDIRPRLVCELCGSRKVIVSFLTPNNKHGTLHRLFEETPR